MRVVVIVVVIVVVVVDEDDVEAEAKATAETEGKAEFEVKDSCMIFAWICSFLLSKGSFNVRSTSSTKHVASRCAREHPYRNSSA